MVLLIAVALGRIVATYWVFNQTMDEPYQVATGLEWWERGTYTLDAVHGPLSRIVIALPAYLRGARLGNTGSGQLEGNRYFYGPGNYLNNLALARVGVLPFFVLAAVVVALWARRLAGEAGAMAAVLLFTTLPPVLAHAGVATTDTPVEATFALGLLVLVGWLANPTPRMGVALGLAAALTATSKLSGLVYLVAAGSAIAVAYSSVGRPGSASGGPWWKTQPGRGRSLALAAAAAALVVWALYRFSWARLPGFPTQDSTLAWVIYGVGRHVPLPAPDFWRAFAIVSADNSIGRHAYLLGATRVGGFPEFFFVALLVKTPLPFLALAAVGGVVMVYQGGRERDWQRLAPVLGAAAILAVAGFTRINIGLRHILPIYPLLAIVAGAGAAWLWKAARQRDDSPRAGWGARAAAGVVLAGLLGWQVWEGVAAHPDYLAYFNQFAGGHGEEILVDSDLDWGQDVLRLAAELQRRKIDDVWFAYFGSANPWLNGMPHSRPLEANQPVTGWVAISEYRLKLGDISPNTWHGYDWLKKYQPVARVGKSILLYYIPPETAR